MNNVAQVKKLLSELAKSDKSSIYAICHQITVYIERHPRQINLTIGGLRAALQRTADGDDLLIRAAFTLSLHPFQALKVRYRLYDENLSEVIQEMEHPDYMVAVSQEEFVDSEGNQITLSDLHRRTFPYFVNMFEAESDPESTASGRMD